MASVAWAKRRIDNKSCKIKYNALKELENGIAPKDVVAMFNFAKISNSLLLELSITRTVFDSPWAFELWRVYCKIKVKIFGTLGKIPENLKPQLIFFL